MENHVHTLIAGGETETVMFFTSTEHKNDLARTISAFANTSGGTLIVGVRKNGKILGTEPSESYSNIVEAAAVNCIPEVPIVIQTLQVQHKIILVVDVLQSPHLHKIDEGEELNYYLRNQNRSIKTNPVLKRFLELKKGLYKAQNDQNEALKLVFETLLSYPQISMTQLVKKVEMKRDQVENILANLLYNHHIDYRLEGERIVYFTK